VSVPRLRVVGILDLQPGRGAAIGAVHATAPLRHYTFKVTLTRHTEQITPALLDVDD
jgi:hypothetical protein